MLSWRLSITMEVDFCLEALEEALAKYDNAGGPDEPSVFCTACSRSLGRKWSNGGFLGVWPETTKASDPLGLLAFGLVAGAHNQRCLQLDWAPLNASDLSE